ncbi:unnamed protein product [Linum tenue]|uniref:Uncharacterized protein n=1 Tax=Linum tenue TaxID=586396 RepID=A0AAV0RWS4_9ROSI|nr:unnamed protein product [Linum tenue]
MGFLVDSQNHGGPGFWGGCVRTLIRRKQVDSADGNVHGHGGHHQLAKELSVLHLIAIGITELRILPCDEEQEPVTSDMCSWSMKLARSGRAQE